MIPSRSVKFVLAAALALGAATVPTAGQAPVARAEALLDALRNHLGPAEAQAAKRSIVVRGRVEFEGYQGLAGTFEELLAADGRYVSELVFPGYEPERRGGDARSGWEYCPPQPASCQEEEGAAALARSYAIFRQVPWRSLYCKVQGPLAEAIRFGAAQEKRASLRFELRTANGQTDTWWLDAEGKTLLRTRIGQRSAAGAPIWVDTEYSDWRDVDGILYPMHRRIRRQDSVLLRIGKSLATVKGFDAAAFALPPAVKALLEGPERGRRRSDEIKVVTTPEQLMVCVRVEGKPEDVGRILGLALPRVLRVVTAAGGKTTGPATSRYVSIADDRVELDVGLPVRSRIRESDGVSHQTLPAIRAITAWHVGPYALLPKTHARIAAYARSKGLIPDGMPWEVYWTDPGREPDASKYETQIFQPVK